MRRFLIFLAILLGLIFSALPGLMTVQSQVPPVASGTSTGQVVPGAPAAAQSRSLKLTIFYDNTVYDNRLKPDWGFAALIEYSGHTLLFDTGADGHILLENMKKFNIDLKSIEIIIFSHDHYDHTGGLGNLLATGIKPTVYMLSSFSEYLKGWARHQTHLIETEQPAEIISGIYITGSMQASDISEQALLIKTGRGTAVITGCAHPGLVQITGKAQEILPGKIVLLAGGFHLLGMDDKHVKSIIKKIHQKDIEKVMPMHCTGDRAISMFQKEFGENFIRGGAGRVLVVE
jgi:7,8-dihydropterin-6-yl-methyl-4-(beta-D-ribofuranosyl)aminobenzene 5'-phosphate synthase